MNGRSGGRIFVIITACAVVWLVAAIAAAAELVLPKTTATFGYKGATGSFSVTVLDSSAPSGSTVDIAVSAPAGITLKSASPLPVRMSAGKGTGKVLFTVPLNTSSEPAPAAVVTLSYGDAAPVSFTINQGGAPCKVTLSNPRGSFEYVGGSGSFQVTAPSGCGWTYEADPKAAGWVVASATATSGNGTVTYTVDPNSGKNRSGKIIITATDPVSQKVTMKKPYTVTQKQRVASFAPPKIVTPTTIEKTAASAGKAALAASRAGLGIGSGGGLLYFFDKVPGLASVSALPALAAFSDHAVRLAPKAAKLTAAVKASPDLLPPYYCGSDGSITIKPTKSGATMVFSSCKEGGEITNGTVTVVSSTDKNGTVNTVMAFGTAASPFTIDTYTDESYATKERSEKAALTTTLSTANTEISTSGFVESTDFTASPALKDIVDMKDFSMSYTGSGSSLSTTSNGGIRDAKFQGSELIAAEELNFQDFTLGWDYSTLGAQYTINGTFSINNIPEQSCLDGTFNVSTTTPITYDFTTGIVSGVFVVNGVTITVTNGTATASWSDGTTITIDNLNSLCPL